MTQTLKALHDNMLAEMPETAQHEEAECPFCTTQIANNTGGKMSETTFTKEQVEAQVLAAVAEAVAPLTEKLGSIEASESAAAVEAKIAEARAEVEAARDAVQADLDAKVIEFSQLKTEHDELVALLESTEAARVEAEAVEARTEERVAAVAAAVTFPDEYVSENASRWASMSDETFEATLADYRAVAEKAGATKAPATKVPAATALVAARDDEGKGRAFSALSEMRKKGADPRQVVR